MREGVLDLTRALDFSCQICNAVDHAHRVGILHRDLRPGNMLVSENGMLKVTDFGTSRSRDRRARDDGDWKPALHGARAVSWQGGLRERHLLRWRHDVPVLTGSMPYDTPAPRTSRDWHAASCCRAPRIKNPKIPKAINDIVLRAMAPDPTERFQRASELLDELLAAREPAPRRAVRRGGMATADATVAEIQSRLRGPRNTPRRASAGTAGSRFTRGPIAARFAAKPNSCIQFHVPGSRFVFMVLVRVHCSRFKPMRHNRVDINLNPCISIRNQEHEAGTRNWNWTADADPAPSMPDSFEHTPTLAVRMPNGGLASLAGNVDPITRSPSPISCSRNRPSRPPSPG